MPDRAGEESTQSGQTPGLPPHEAVTGKFRPMDFDSTGRHDPVSDASGDTGRHGAITPTHSDQFQHELSSGPPAIPGYDIVGELGRGGMGVVYKAWHVPTKRFVALKMILTGANASERQRNRFRIEAEAAHRLSHPNIIDVYEAGEFRAYPYFSLEFCGGGSLARKLAGNPMLPQAAAILMEKIARAIAFAHERQIIHRDLKPANILLLSDGEPKITDFGLAKRLDADDVQTRTGAVMGTPSYMPPEQAIGAGDQVGPSVDIYALGAVLYECLTGRPPFKSATAMDTLEQVRHQTPVSPRLLNASVPLELDAICLKCLRKSPRERYQSATELADELKRYLSGTPIQTPLSSELRDVWNWLIRRPVRGGIIALVAIAVLALAVIGMLSMLHP